MFKSVISYKANMLKSSVTRIHAHRRCLSYFSNVFNNLATQGPQNISNQTQDVVNQRVNILDLDVFVNHEHKQMDLLDKLIKLRKQKDSTAVPLLPNILVKQLLDFSGPQDTINVLRNPLQYGIFIDQFTGCHLMDLLLHNNRTQEAAQVAALLIERDLCNNELVASLSFQSFYGFFKKYEPKLKEKVEQLETVKVRVKYLRNSEKTSEKSEDKILGEALLKLGLTPSLEEQIKKNTSLLGFVVCDGYTEAVELITQNKQFLYKDVLEVCLNIVEKGERNPEFKNLLDKALQECSQFDSIDEILETRVKLCVENYEPQLIAEYDKCYQEWSTGFQRAVQNQTKILETNIRVKNVEATLDTLQTTRQNLWFFENKEDIDIAIFKNKVFYPKRWFGKKKKPRAVDSFYIPPTISRAN